MSIKLYCFSTYFLFSGNKEGKTVYQNSTKQLLICKLPPVMIFHLKRFQLQNCSFRKISRHVDFPLVLDVSQFCVKNEVSDFIGSCSLFWLLVYTDKLKIQLSIVEFT